MGKEECVGVNGDACRDWHTNPVTSRVEWTRGWVLILVSTLDQVLFAIAPWVFETFFLADLHSIRPTVVIGGSCLWLIWHQSVVGEFLTLSGKNFGACEMAFIARDSCVVWLGTMTIGAFGFVDSVWNMCSHAAIFALTCVIWHWKVGYFFISQRKSDCGLPVDFVCFVLGPQIRRDDD